MRDGRSPRGADGSGGCGAGCTIPARSGGGDSRSASGLPPEGEREREERGRFPSVGTRRRSGDQDTRLLPLPFRGTVSSRVSSMNVTKLTGAQDVCCGSDRETTLVPSPSSSEPHLSRREQGHSLPAPLQGLPACRARIVTRGTTLSDPSLLGSVSVSRQESCGIGALAKCVAAGPAWPHSPPQVPGPHPPSPSTPFLDPARHSLGVDG